MLENNTLEQNNSVLEQSENELNNLQESNAKEQNNNTSNLSDTTYENKQTVMNNITNNESEDNMQDDDKNDDKNKKKKSKDDPFSNITVLNEPKRKLPKVIEMALDNNIPVTLSKNGYFVGGFYGLNYDNQHEGFAFAQETSEDGSLAFYDMKNHKFLVKNFEDLVKFHNHVWGQYYKISDNYKKPDMLWFGFLLQYEVLTITPGSMR